MEQDFCAFFALFLKDVVKSSNSRKEEEGFKNLLYSTVFFKRIYLEIILINGKIWICKNEALKWAQENRFHAIIAHLKNETNYLRPEYKSKPFEIIWISYESITSNILISFISGRM